MAIPFLPIIGAISNVAGTALGIYRRNSDTRASFQQQLALNERLAALEESDFEKAHLLSDLAADLQQFALEVQAELANSRQRERQTRSLAFGSFFLVLVSAALCVFLVSR